MIDTLSKSFDIDELKKRRGDCDPGMSELLEVDPMAGQI